MTRITTSGNRRPHVVAPGYKYESQRNARFERPEGEPSLLVGTLILLAGFAAVAGLVLLIGGAP